MSALLDVHEVKSWPEFFEAVWIGHKPFEIRKDDRDYKVGDALTLREWCPMLKRFLGRVIVAEITYRTTFEQHDGFVVLGIRLVRRYGKREAKR